MRILIVTAGSHGDVHPFLGIGKALARMGHEATVLTNPYFESDVRAAGLAFEPHGEFIDLPTFIREMDLMHPTRGPGKVFRWIFENTPRLLGELDSTLTARAPDVVLHHMICLGTPWLCKRRGIPAVAASLAPAVWFSRADPIPAIQREPTASDARSARLMTRVFAGVAVGLGSAKLNKLRLACGYAKQSRAIAQDFRGGDLHLGLWSREFRAPMVDDDPVSRVTGFPLYDGGDHRPMPPELARFLDEGERPVVFALGTTAVHVAAEFYRHAAEVCRSLGRRGVLLCGKAGNVPARLPGGVIAIGYAPFSQVLPRGATSVVHGGIGSVAQALAAGRPTVVTPFSHDQFNNGVRVQALGVGYTLGRRRLTVERLAQAVGACLEDPALIARAGVLGAAIGREDGAGQAARTIVEFVGSGAAGSRVL